MEESAAVAVQNTTPRRWISVLELVAGSAIVIGHNVFHVVPNEVLILVPLGWLSLRLRDGGWRAVGLKRPASWGRTLLFAAAVAAAIQLVSEFVVTPLAVHVFHNPPDLSDFKPLVGNLKQSLIMLGLVWTFAAFGEEMSYRGYLVTRAADLGRRTKLAYWMGVLYVMLLFGIGHWYQGPSGVMDTATTGLFLGAAYVLSGRNLWVPILAHGLSDTYALVMVFFNLVPQLRK